MKYILLATAFMLLFSFQSCSKAEKQDLQNIIINDYNTIEEDSIGYLPNNLSEYLENYFESNKDDKVKQILSIEYESEDEIGYRISFNYSENGKILKEHQRNLYLDSSENSNQENILLNERFGYESDRGNYRLSIEYFFQALQSYQNGDLAVAIELIERTLKTYTLAIYYYHYGIFLMDNNDYENAEKSFFKALQLSYVGFSDPFRNYITDSYGKRNPIYTFDENGAPREIYFTLYNLACIYSLRMELDKSLDFIIMSIEWGYPYFEHLSNDTDLSNLFTINNEAKQIINSVYQKGFVDELVGKVVEFTVASDNSLYSFEDNNVVKLYFRNSDIQEHTFHGVYIVRNYNIIIYFYEETGRRGFGQASNAGVRTHYENYGDIYTKSLSSKRMISINSFKYGTGEGIWKEIEKKDSYWSF